MLFAAFASISLLLAVVAFYFGARILGRFKWILGWLRGMAGLALIAIAVFLALAGLDLLSYKQILKDKPLLTISFEKQEEQVFQATLLFIESNEEQSFEVQGDQWQVDARIIRWKGFFQMLGAKPGYRLDRLSGRYYSLEDERRKKRSAHELSTSKTGLDMWALVHENSGFVPLLDAVYGSATYLPMEDGAIYQISLSASGLVATPMNAIAEKAISRWR